MQQRPIIQPQPLDAEGNPTTPLLDKLQLKPIRINSNTQKQAQPQDQKERPDIDWGFEDYAKMLATGVGNLMNRAGGAMEWASNAGDRYSNTSQALRGIGRDLSSAGTKINEANQFQSELEHFEWDDLTTPEGWSRLPSYAIEGILTSAPEMAITLPIGGVAGKGAGLTLKVGSKLIDKFTKLGLSPKMAGKLGTEIAQGLGAGFGQSASVGMLEAGDVYRQAIQQGYTPEEASEGAMDVLADNLLLTAVNAPQYVGLFANRFPQLQKLANKFKIKPTGTAGKVAKGTAGATIQGAGEGVEEVYQRGSSDTATQNIEEGRYLLGSDSRLGTARTLMNPEFYQDDVGAEGTAGFASGFALSMFGRGGRLAGRKIAEARAKRNTPPPNSIPLNPPPQPPVNTPITPQQPVSPTQPQQTQPVNPTPAPSPSANPATTVQVGSTVILPDGTKGEVRAITPNGATILTEDFDFIQEDPSNLIEYNIQEESEQESEQEQKQEQPVNDPYNVANAEKWNTLQFDAWLNSFDNKTRTNLSYELNEYADELASIEGITENAYNGLMAERVREIDARMKQEAEPEYEFNDPDTMLSGNFVDVVENIELQNEKFQRATEPLKNKIEDLKRDKASPEKIKQVQDQIDRLENTLSESFDEKLSALVDKVLEDTGIEASREDVGEYLYDTLFNPATREYYWGKPFQKIVDDMVDQFSIDSQEANSQTQPSAQSDNGSPLTTDATNKPLEIKADSKNAEGDAIKTPATLTDEQAKNKVLAHYGGLYESVADASPEEIYENIPEVDEKQAKRLYDQIKQEFEAEKAKNKDAKFGFEKVEPKPDVKVSSKPEPKKKTLAVGEYNTGFKTAKKALGTEQKYYLPNNEERDSQYAVVPLSSIQASHNEETFKQTDGFPTLENGATPNDNDYERNKDAQAKVFDIAQNLNNKVIDNMPVVSSDGIVVSGNNRTMSLKRASKYNKDKYNAYVTELKNRAKQFGIDPSAVEGIENPVLVRIDKNVPDYSTDEFKRHNEKDNKSKSPIEQAVIVSKTMTADKAKRLFSQIDSEQFSTIREALNDTKVSKALAKALLDTGVIGQNDLPMYYDSATGSFNQFGREFIELVAIGAVLDESALRNSSKEGVRQFASVIETSLPMLLTLKSNPDFDLSSLISRAIDLKAKQVDGNLSDSDVYAQQSMFDDMNTERDVAIVHLLMNKGTKAFKKMLQVYYNDALSGGASLFATEPKKRLDLVNEILDFFTKNAKDKDEQFTTRVIGQITRTYEGNQRSTSTGDVNGTGLEKPASDSKTATEQTEEVEGANLNKFPNNSFVKNIYNGKVYRIEDNGATKGVAEIRPVNKDGEVNTNLKPQSFNADNNPHFVEFIPEKVAKPKDKLKGMLDEKPKKKPAKQPKEESKFEKADDTKKAEEDLSALFDEFNDKFGNNLNAGIDPQAIILSGKIIAKGAELGYKVFRDYVNFVIKAKGKDFLASIFQNFKTAYVSYVMNEESNDEDLNAIKRSKIEDYVVEQAQEQIPEQPKFKKIFTSDEVSDMSVLEAIDELENYASKEVKELVPRLRKLAIEVDRIIKTIGTKPDGFPTIFPYRVLSHFTVKPTTLTNEQLVQGLEVQMINVGSLIYSADFEENYLKKQKAIYEKSKREKEALSLEALENAKKGKEKRDRIAEDNKSLISEFPLTDWDAVISMLVAGYTPADVRKVGMIQQFFTDVDGKNASLLKVKGIYEKNGKSVEGLIQAIDSKAMDMFTAEKADRLKAMLEKLLPKAKTTQDKYGTFAIPSELNKPKFAQMLNRMYNKIDSAGDRDVNYDDEMKYISGEVTKSPYKIYWDGNRLKYVETSQLEKNLKDVTTDGFMLSIFKGKDITGKRDILLKSLPKEDYPADYLNALSTYIIENYGANQNFAERLSNPDNYKLSRPAENTLITVNIDKLVEKHLQDEPDYSLTDPNNRIGNRIQKAEKWLSENPDAKLEPAQVYFNESGFLSYADGRHRTVSAKNLGATEIVIEVPKGQAQQIKQALSTQQSQSDPEAVVENGKLEQSLPEYLDKMNQFLKDNGIAFSDGLETNFIDTYTDAVYDAMRNGIPVSDKAFFSLTEYNQTRLRKEFSDLFSAGRIYNPEIKAVTDEYGYRAEFIDQHNIMLFNRKGKHNSTVVIDKKDSKQYRINDVNGNKLLTGNGQLGESVKNVLTKHFYAMPNETAEKADNLLGNKEPKYKLNKVVGVKKTSFGWEHKVNYKEKSDGMIKLSTDFIFLSPTENINYPSSFESDEAVDKFKQSLQELPNVPNTPRDSQPDSPTQSNGNNEVQPNLFDVGEPSGQLGNEGTKQVNPAGSKQSGSRSDNQRPSTAGGKQGNNTLFGTDQTAEPTQSDAGSPNSTRGSNANESGNDADQRTSTTGGNSPNTSFQDLIKQNREKQKQAESIKETKLMDEANIRATLPFLLPEQQDDVIKAENRFFGKEHKTAERAYGKGMLYTNGTGTGKTYTGMGIIKRFARQGKGNILIVVPSQPKVSDWIDAGKDLLLSISALKDTKDAGEGIVVTTYANFRSNQSLLERDFDLVLYDESHRIMESNKGDVSATTKTHFQISNVTENDALRRIKEVHPLWIRENELRDKIEQEGKFRANLDRRQDVYDASVFVEQKLKDELKQVNAEQKKILPELEARAKKDYENTKVVFLSATPFKTQFNLRYANNVLFKWKEEETYESASNGASRVDPQSRFFLDNFGAKFEWKFHRLQEKGGADPEAIAMQEIAFANRLIESGAMSGRAIESNKDYARYFPLVADKNTEIFNTAFNKLFNFSRYKTISFIGFEVFKDYNYSTKLLEALRANHAIKRVQEHIKLGRKVVVFHRRKQGDVRPPFEEIYNKTKELLDSLKGLKKPSEQDAKLLAELEEDLPKFVKDMAEVMEYEQTLVYESAINQFKEVFKDRVTFVNGDITKKGAKEKAIADFNDPNSDVDIIMVQEESGKEGISLHDTHGIKPRVLMSLSLPISSITAIQVEGRIYRIGNESDAIFEYPILGLDFEIAHFGQTFNKKLSTTENLAMGDLARDLLTSFSQGVAGADIIPASDVNGLGGKALDKRADETKSLFDKAILYYKTNQKIRGRRDQRQGADFYPTPEPVGQKMVEWLQLETGEKALEPSAGRGAIAMWFSGAVKSTAIEPSFDLYSKLVASTKTDDVKHQTFEDLNIINKYHGIAMNPPFGVGGATAMEHIKKATKHLYLGGRIVALVPDGGAFEKKLDKWYESDEANEFQITKVIKLPRVTFEQAGTAIATKIVVIDKIGSKKQQETGFESMAQPQQESEIQAESINELFDNLRNVKVPERSKVKEEASEAPKTEGVKAEKPLLEIGEHENTKTNEIQPIVRLTKFLGSDIFEDLKELSKYAKGYYSPFAKGFLFKQTKDAEDFLERANRLIADTKHSPDPDEPNGRARLKKMFDDEQQADEPLRAPNGKPSKLTPEQWNQVRTPEFKAWFGDWENDPENASKVVDENGEPLVVYHGTVNDFYEFVPNKVKSNAVPIKGGIFFTSSEVVASAFGIQAKLRQLDTERVIPVFLNVKDPVVEKNKSWKDVFAYKADVNKSNPRIKNLNSIIAHKDGVHIRNAEDIPFIGRALDFVKNGGKHDVWMVTSPNQIKSATKNTGAFDPENNDIRFQLIGEVGAKNLDIAEKSTYRLNNLQVAREMEQAGKDAKTIRLATGWERGADGLWRYEIPDIKIKDLNDKKVQQYLENNKSYLSIFLEYNKESQQLMDLYWGNHPNLKSIYVTIRPVIFKGEQSHAEYITGERITDREIIINVEEAHLKYVDGKRVYTEEGLRQIQSMLIHEIQHAIQDNEGFSRGSSPQAQGLSSDVVPLKAILEFENSNEEYRTLLEKDEKRIITSSEKKRMKDMFFKFKEEYFKKNNIESGYSKYRRIAGEVEARNVQSRINMTPEQRRETLLTETEDIAREDQIVIQNAMNNRMAYQQLEDKYLQFTQHAKRFMAGWANKPNVSFYTNVDEFIQLYPSQKWVKDAKAKAIYFEDEVHIILDMAENTKELEESILHEIIGHHGLRGFFFDYLSNEPVYDEFNQMMDEIFLSFQDSPLMPKLAKAYYNSTPSKITIAESRVLAEEYIAHIAETQEADFVDRLVALIRRLMRKIKGLRNLVKNWNDREIRTLISMSKAYIMNENGQLEPSLYHKLYLFSQKAPVKTPTLETKLAYLQKTYPDYSQRMQIDPFRNMGNARFQVSAGDSQIGLTDEPLKAPNGKPSNLTPAQWKQVRTPEFKKFFGDWELMGKETSIVAVDAEHGFKNYKEAEKWAKKNIIGAYRNDDTNELINVSGNSIEKFTNGSAINKSVSKNEHLSTLRVVPQLLKTAILAESHADRDGNIKEIQRFYSAISLNGVTRRVKLTVKVYKDNKTSKAYSYEVLEIEMLEGNPVDETNNSGLTSNSTSSISMEKLLKGAKKNNGEVFDTEYSKVLDENGEPMVVYHGSVNKNVFEFDTTLITQRSAKGDIAGTYFTSDKRIAYNYTKDRADKTKKGEVTPAFLNIRNPLNTTKEIAKQRKKGLAFSDAKREALKALDKEGTHDGIVFNGNSSNNDEFVVFEPNQIKSATKNTGTFDPDNNDIRFRKELPTLGTANEAPLIEYKRFDDKVRYWQDKMIDLKRLQETKQKEGAVIQDEANPYMMEETHYGRVDAQRRHFEKKLLNPFMETMRKIADKSGKTYMDISEYLYAKYAPIRNEEIYSRNREELEGKIAVQEELLKGLEESLEALESEKILAQTPDEIAEVTDKIEALKRRISARNAQITRLNNKIDNLNQSPSGMSDAEASAIVDAIEQAVSDSDLLKTLHDQAKAMTDFTVQTWFDAGLISDKRYEKMIASEYYVPLRGFEEVIDVDATVFSGDIPALGRTSRAGDVIAYMLTMADTAIIRAEKNKIMQSMVEFVKQNPDLRLYKAQNVWFVNTGKKDDVSGKDIFEATTDKPEAGVVASRDIDWSQAQVYWRNTDPKKSVRAYYNGRPTVITFNQPHIPNALANVGVEKVPQFLRNVAKAMRYLRNTYTQYSPEFALRNFMRDSMEGFVHLTQDFDVKTANAIVNPIRLAGIMRGMRQIIRSKSYAGEWATWYKKFEDNGGRSGMWQLDNVATHTKALQKMVERHAERNILHMTANGFNAFLQLVEDYNAIVENAVRVSTFRYLVENKGYSELQGASYAKNLTVNFNRKGNGSSWAGTLYLFFNAGVQGISRLIKPFKSDNASIRRKAMLTPLIMAGSAFMWAELMRMIMGAGDDEEDYIDKQSTWMLTHNILIPNILSDDDNDFFRIPLPYGYNTYWSLGMIMNQMAHGVKDLTETALTLTDIAMGSFSPIGGLESENAGVAFSKLVAPTLMDPVIELSMNENFAGSPIYREQFTAMNGIKKLPNAEVYYESANDYFVDIAQYLNKLTGGTQVESGKVDVSPEIMEYMLSQITGGTGQFFMKSLDFMRNVGDGDAFEGDKIRKVPFLSALMTDTSPYVDIRRFYEGFNELQEKHIKYRAYLELDPKLANAYFKEHQQDLIRYYQSKPIVALFKDERDIDKFIKSGKMAEGTPNPLDLVNKNMVTEFNRENNRAKKIRSLLD